MAAPGSPPPVSSAAGADAAWSRGDPAEEFQPAEPRLTDSRLTRRIPSRESGSARAWSKAAARALLTHAWMRPAVNGSFNGADAIPALRCGVISGRLRGLPNSAG